jgi:hypothetical protein
MLKTRIFLSLLILFFFSNSVRADLLEGAAGIEARVNRFVNSDHAYRSLLDYQSTVGFSGKSAFQPWSSTYWPLDQGMAAHAYADKGGHGHSFFSNQQHFHSRIKKFLRRQEKNKLDAQDFEVLSPTEKYDLFLGDLSFSLTASIWKSLAEHQKATKRKKIQDWEGVCHGWAPAAAFMNRPVKKFTVQSIDGRFSIPFYPDDIKALSSLLWANSLVQDNSIVEGIRCDTNGPQVDYGSGKVLRTRCKGVNPGVWHLTVLGLIGEKHRSFIINKNNDIEIWNQPANSFEFKYYNPKTQATGRIEEVSVPVKSFSDIFSKYRDPNTAYIVGVDMNFGYIDETEPSHVETDDPTKDLLANMHMKYELELDAGYNVLGGEWVQTDDQDRRYIPNYPAFMWRFPSDYPMALSIMDAKIPSMNDPLAKNSPFMRSLSIQASTFRYQRYQIDDTGDIDKLELDENGKPIPAGLELRPQPLGKVIYHLLEKAQ